MVSHLYRFLLNQIFEIFILKHQNSKSNKKKIKDYYCTSETLSRHSVRSRIFVGGVFFFLFFFIERVKEKLNFHPTMMHVLHS